MAHFGRLWIPYARERRSCLGADEVVRFLAAVGGSQPEGSCRADHSRSGEPQGRQHRQQPHGHNAALAALPTGLRALEAKDASVAACARSGQYAGRAAAGRQLTAASSPACTASVPVRQPAGQPVALRRDGAPPEWCSARAPIAWSARSPRATPHAPRARFGPAPSLAAAVAPGRAQHAASSPPARHARPDLPAPGRPRSRRSHHGG
jgi:hypothetical protein